MMWIVASIPFLTISSISFIIAIFMIGDFVYNCYKNDTREAARSASAFLGYMIISSMFLLAGTWAMSNGQ